MNRCFFGNFDFEYQLVAPEKSAPFAVRRRNAELAHLWIAVAEAGDVWGVPPLDEPGFLDELRNHGLIPPEQLAEDNRRDDLRLAPWGWSAPALDWARRCGVAADAPPLDVVRRANSRRFSVELEREFGVALPGTQILEHPGELQAALRTLPAERWLLKAEFGMSARERLSGRGEPQVAVENWFRRKLRENQAVILEPWVDVVEEAGLQFEIPKAGPPMLAGVTPLITDDAGVYRGSRFDDDAALPERWADAVAAATLAAERIQSLGYFGPLGIDAARFRDAAGRVALRPLQDVNARTTMGRLSLGFRRLLHPGEPGVWLHQRWPTDSADAPERWFNAYRASLPDSLRLIRTSPFSIEGRPVSHGGAVVAGDGATE